MQGDLDNEALHPYMNGWQRSDAEAVEDLAYMEQEVYGI